jgi:L-seryl-tRNA(Ser) seleniumtransferase
LPEVRDQHILLAPKRNPKPQMTKSQTNSTMRALPSVDSLLRSDTAVSLRPQVGAGRLGSLARQVTEELRRELLAVEANPSANDGSRGSLLREAESRLAAAHRDEVARGLRRVINATGVVLHTNLGRAPLSAAARCAIDGVAGYCNLEYDVVNGIRGRRGPRAEDLLAELTGAESALVVNNCAAAALLVLTTLAHDGETIVSRGELVEIGGDFRVPDVMEQSGTKLIEVGTTNRTRLSDYQKAISEKTRLLMRVHASNYRIVGFTETPSLKDLAGLAHDRGLTLFEDAGSGALVDFHAYGIDGEPVIRESIEAGVDVVSFSGDKLLGGPQTGLVVGRSEIVERMRKQPLYRVLRADKLRLAGLEATLDAYARGVSAIEVPTHQFIALSADELKSRAAKLIKRLRNKLPAAVEATTTAGESAVGGGSAPTSLLPTVLIQIKHPRLSANEIERSLRGGEPPVISRIVNDQVLLDLRTVGENEETDLINAILSLTA